MTTPTAQPSLNRSYLPGVKYVTITYIVICSALLGFNFFIGLLSPTRLDNMLGLFVTFVLGGIVTLLWSIASSLIRIVANQEELLKRTAPSLPNPPDPTSVDQPAA